MDFLGFLRDLFGGGQKSEAPPAPQPRSNPRQADYQDSRPAAAPARDPFRPSAPAFTPLPAPYTPAAAPAPAQNNSGPWRTINFAPPPANAPTPLNLQAPQLEEPMFQRGQEEAQKQVATKKAASQQNNYFGDEGEYAPQEMSVDAYLQLEPRQRAAVDANTALVQAAEQDIASWAKSNVAGKPIDDQNYLSQVKESFGDTGGSDTYAPRTMAVLSDLGLDLQGRDLDQYLNRSALVTDADLQLLSAPSTALPGVRAEDPRQENATTFATAASNRLSETLATGQTLLDSIRSSSDANRQLFGAPAVTAPLGVSGSERDVDLKKAFDVFSQARSQQDLTPETVNGVYAELQAKHGVTPNEVAQYFETRLQANEYLNAAEDSNVTLGGPTSSLEYLAPQDFRSKFLTRGA